MLYLFSVRIRVRAESVCMSVFMFVFGCAAIFSSTPSISFGIPGAATSANITLQLCQASSSSVQITAVVPGGEFTLVCFVFDVVMSVVVVLFVGVLCFCCVVCLLLLLLCVSVICASLACNVQPFRVQSIVGCSPASGVFCLSPFGARNLFVIR